MDLMEQIHFYTLDTLGELAYSRPLGFIETNKDQGSFLKINKAMLPLLATLSNYTGFYRMMQYWPLRLLLPGEGDKVGMGVLMG